MLTMKNPSRTKTLFPPPPLYPYGMQAQWDITHVGGNTWQLDAAAPITQTGAAVITNYNFTIYHRLIELEFKHTTAAGADSADPMTIYLNFIRGGNIIRQWSIQNTASSSIVLSYRDEGGRSYAPQTYQIITTSTATDLVVAHVTLEVSK